MEAAGAAASHRHRRIFVLFCSKTPLISQVVIATRWRGLRLVCSKKKKKEKARSYFDRHWLKDNKENRVSVFGEKTFRLLYF